MAGFRKTLIQAAEKAQSEGSISRGQLFLLRFQTLSPRVCSQLEEALVEEAASMGVIPVQAAGNIGAIDWSTLMEFIKQMLPFIMQLISLFSRE